MENTFSKTQVERTGMKSTMVEIQNTLNVTEGRLGIAEEMISECEDRIETILNETQVKITLKKHLSAI